MDPSTAPPLSRCYREVSQAAAGKRACEPVESKRASARLTLIVQELCESRDVRPNEPSGFRGRKELLHRASALVTTCP